VLPDHGRRGLFYERLGFRAVPSAAISPALRAIVEGETRRGLDPDRRVVMERPCERMFAASDHATLEDAGKRVIVDSEAD